MLATNCKNAALSSPELPLRLELGEPNEQSKEVAVRELRETQEIKQQAIAELRKLLAAETDLHCPLDNEDWLVCFLRPCKFYAESARDMIKRYYKFKSKYANICEGLVPSREQRIIQQDLVTMLCDRDQLGRRMGIIRFGTPWDTSEFSMDDIMKDCILWLELVMSEPNTEINGVVAIFDLEGFTLKHALQFTPAAAKRLLNYLQFSVPLRLKAAHIVFQPKVFDVAFTVMKGFLTEKFRKRIYFHGNDLESLHKYISPACLPAHYEGYSESPVCNGKQTYELFMQYEKEFELRNTYGYKK